MVSAAAQNCSQQPEVFDNGQGGPCNDNEAISSTVDGSSSTPGEYTHANLIGDHSYADLANLNDGPDQFFIFKVSQIPVPASLPPMLTALPSLGFLKRRRVAA